MLIPISDAATELGVEIGIIGGSGFYDYLDDPVEITVTTPYGEAAAPIAVGTIADRRVAFLPRHGRRHDVRRRTGCRSGPTSGRWRHSACVR